MDAEKKLLIALVYMVEQYLERDDGLLDHQFMTAGETAIEVLRERGLIESDEGGRFARWSEAGNRFRNSK
jgi:hypothetical protein